MNADIQVMSVDELTMREAIHNDQLCKMIGGAVLKAYPSRRWFIEVTDRGRFCYIRIPSISMIYGMGFSIMGTHEQNAKKAVKMAGELLERFNLKRAAVDNEDILSLRKGLTGVVGAEKGEL